MDIHNLIERRAFLKALGGTLANCSARPKARCGRSVAATHSARWCPPPAA